MVILVGLFGGLYCLVTVSLRLIVCWFVLLLVCFVWLLGLFLGYFGCCLWLSVVRYCLWVCLVYVWWLL